MGRRVRRWLVTLLAAVVVLYGAFVAAIFAAMLQPIERFGRVMSYMPGPLFMVIPFEPLWNVARRGRLDVGDPAPDFALRAVDAKGRPAASGQVQLSSFRGRQPVVLVFGSYT